MGIDRLVPLAVSLHVGTMNVRRQRDMPQLFELSEEIRYRLEPHRALTEFAVGYDLRAQCAVAEGQRFSGERLAPRPCQNSPLPLGHLLRQQYLDSPAGVMSRLRVKAGTMRIEPCRNHSAVVQHQQ